MLSRNRTIQHPGPHSGLFSRYHTILPYCISICWMLGCPNLLQVATGIDRAMVHGTRAILERILVLYKYGIIAPSCHPLQVVDLHFEYGEATPALEGVSMSPEPPGIPFRYEVKLLFRSSIRPLLKLTPQICSGEESGANFSTITVTSTRHFPIQVVPDLLMNQNGSRLLYGVAHLGIASSTIKIGAEER